MKVLNIVKNDLDEFHKNNINYCHFKSNEHVDAAVIGDTDLDILVYSKCDIETSFQRLRKRNNQRTRFDFWDDKKCLINLERMNNIFEYVNNYSFGMIISIDANDEIENKVRLIYKKIYG